MIWFELQNRCTRACLQSPGPQDAGNGVDHRSEAGIGLFVARSDASKRLDGTEEVFDEVTPSVLFRIVRGVSSRAFAQRNDRLDVPARQVLAQPVRIERLVADEGQTVDASHQSIEARDVVAIARQQHEADHISKRVDNRRYLRRPTAARFADGLFLSPPFAPVPCWWTRMCVASMRTYSKSGSSDKRLKTRSQVPFCAHRQNRV